MDLASFQPFVVSIAIFLADFMLFGVFIPPFIMLASFTFFSSIPRRCPVSSPFLVLFWFSALVNLAGNVEGSLVAVHVRDAIILLITIVPISVFLVYVIRRNVSKGALRGPDRWNNATP